MAVRHDHPESRRHQGYLLQIRQELIEQPHRKIGLPRIKRRGRILVAPGKDGQPDRGVGSAKPSDGREIKVPQTSGCHHGYSSVELARFGYGPFDGFSNGFENSLRVFVQRLSLGCQDQLSARVLKEFYAELSLEHLDLERDGRRRQERPLGGFFDGSMPRDQTQALQMAEFHKNNLTKSKYLKIDMISRQPVR